MNRPASSHSATGEARAAVARLAAWLVALALPAILLRGTIADAAGAGAILANGGALTANDRLLAFGIAPIVAVSASALFMAPGLLLTFLAGRANAADRWIVSAFGVSIFVNSLLAAMGQAVYGAEFRGAFFGWTIMGLVGVIALTGILRPPRATGAPRDPSHRATITLALLVPLVLSALFAPKLHWEAFNGDGAHAFESARLLLSRPLPFWPESAGDVAAFPGLTSMLFAFPAGWYLRLFGPVDAAARLPLLLYLPLLVSALAWVIQAGRDNASLRLDGRLLVWLGTVTYAVAMAWSATYNPYAADLALPATQDTLLLVVFLGFVAAFVERERMWVVLFAILTHVSLPNGLILIAFWMLAIFVAWRPVPWKEVRWLAGLLAALVIGGALLPRLLALAQLPIPGREYGLVGILRYFAFLHFTDAARLVWVALPCGIVPIVATMLWGKQDRVARALSLVSVAYFLFFFVQANVSLHHFVPSMILPLAVLWRVIPSDGLVRRRWVGVTAAAGLLSMVLVWPPHATPHVDGRHVGETVWNRVGGYDESSAESFAGSMLLQRLFPVDWDPRVPAVYGGSRLVWHRYARAADGVGVNYILQKQSDAPPTGSWLLADSAGFAIYVRSDSVWNQHRQLHPPTPAGSRWLAVPRWTLFRTVKAEGNTHVIDVARMLRSFGLPVDKLLERLGVQP